MGMGAGKWLGIAAALAVLTFLGYELGRRSLSGPPSGPPVPERWVRRVSPAWVRAQQPQERSEPRA